MGRKVKDETLYILIRNFFLVYLPVQRKASANTIRSYRTVWNQLLKYTAESRGISITDLTIDMLNADVIGGFLNHLDADNGSSPATRNHRLAAIRSFFKFAAGCKPEYIERMSSLSNLKPVRDDPFSKAEFMTEAAIQAILAAPDTSTRIGVRDQFMMILLYDSGARIQELMNLKICDIRQSKTATVILHGKGNKIRSVPLTENTMQHLKRYLAIFHEGVPQESKRPLFYVTHKGTMEPMNDDTARIRIYHYANIARELCSEVPQKVHPHMFRHSRAMHLYQHGMPLELVSQWLGHKNVVTTQIYAYADTEAKREAIHRAMGNKEVYHTQAYIEKDEDVLRRLYGL